MEKSGKPGVFSLLKAYSGMVALLICMALLGSGSNLLIPKIIARAIDAYSASRYIEGRVILEFMVVAMSIFLFSSLQNIFQTYVSERVARDLRTRLSEKISRQAYSYVQKANPARLLTNLTSDVDSVKMFVSQAFVTIISSLFIIAGTALLLLMINWRLALAVLTIVPIIAGAFYLVLKKVRVLFRRSREVIDTLNKVINGSILGSALIRVLNCQQTESLKFLEANLESRNLGLSILRLFSTLIPTIMFVANLAVVTILALGGHLVILGNMTLGNFAAFNSYLFLLIFPILMIGFMSNLIAQASASYNRIKEVLDAPEVVETGHLTHPISGDIRLEQVALSIEGKQVLRDISFEVKAGSRTAIIGPTAAGKSQLICLLANLVTPCAGTVRFDGIPVGEYAQGWLHSQVGIVFQDSVVFNMTIRENIAFNDRVTEASMAKAVATAELAEFIESLPLKYETVISERGTSLSGGQKQRIMLARTLAMNPKVLLLDDFTARVDRKTESRILANLEKNYPEMTLISVTQKINPVKNFDQILLLMEGEMIGKGTHSELLAGSPEYVQIYQSQKSMTHYEL